MRLIHVIGVILAACLALGGLVAANYPIAGFLLFAVGALGMGYLLEQMARTVNILAALVAFQRESYGEISDTDKS